MTRLTALRGGDRAATILELAIVFPVFAAMILGLINFGLIEASDSSASNGAREGARHGILEYLNADVAGSPNRVAIEKAVTDKVGSLVRSPTIQVRCQRTSGSTFATVPCGSAIVLNRDYIEVTVNWTSASPFSSGTRTERARMVIQGKPDLADITPPSTTTTSSTTSTTTGSSSTTTPSCTITGVTISSQPGEIELRNQLDLKNNETFTVSTTGTGCGALTFDWPSGPGYPDTVVGSPNAGAGVYAATLAKHTGTWAVGTTYQLVVRPAVGAPFTLTFTTA